MNITIKKQHRRFGLIQANRFTCGPNGMAMFGSTIKHNSGITITITKADVMDMDNHEHIANRDQIASVTLSEYQWGQFVSSMNCGNGIPCTLNQDKDGHIIGENIELDAKFYDYAETDGAARRAQSQLDGVIDRLDSIIKSGKSIGKKELASILWDMQIARGNFKADALYTVTKVQESCEKVVANAKAEIESYVLNRQLALGLENKQDKLLQ